MKNLKYRPVILSIVLAACSGGKSSRLDSTIAGNHPTLGKIGMGYDPDTNRLYPTGNICVAGTTEKTTNQESAALVYAHDLDSDSLKSKLYAAGDLSLDMPTWNVSGSGSFLTEHTGSELSSTFNYLYTALGPEISYVAGDPLLNEYGINILTQELNGEVRNFAKYCGSEYISQIRYGASLIFTLRIDYFDEAQKQEINAAINASVAGVSVSGKFEKMDESTLTNTKITVLADQFGGSASGLTKIMSENIVECSLQNMKECTETVNLLIKYAKGEFTESLNADNWAILNYETSEFDGMAYKKDGELKTVAFLPFPDMKDYISRWQGSYDEATQIIDRSEYLLSFTSSSLTEDQRKAIKSLQSIAKDRRKGFYELLRVCFDRGNDCELEIATKKEEKLTPLPSGYEETLSPNVIPVITKKCLEDSDFKFEADLYRLPNTTTQLPNFANLTPAKTICLKQLNIISRHDFEGFPGIIGKAEWFGLDINFVLIVDQDGTYGFFVNTDDGTRLSIDGAELLKLDGIHESNSTVSSVHLAKGPHKFRLEYFQAWGDMTLELKWQPPGAAGFDYLPLDLVDHP